MEEKDGSRYRIRAVANTYYGNLKKNCDIKEINRIDTRSHVRYTFDIEKCKTCPFYLTCSEKAAYTALRWYEAELRLIGSPDYSKLVEAAREYLEFLKAGRGEYRY